MSCEGQRCRCLHFLNNRNKSSYKHLKWPWPDLSLFTLPEFDLKLHNLTMESVSSTFLIFYPSIFQHRHTFSISSTNFFLLYLNIVRCLLLSETEGCVIKALVPALLVKHQWLNPSVLISCSHAKKKKLSQAVLIPGTHGAISQPTCSRTDTKYYSFSFFMLPPGICFRGNINHSGKGEKENVFYGKHLGENCSMASLSWLGIALSIKFSTSETPHGNSVLLLSSRTSDSLEPKIESLLKTVVTQ